MELLVAIAQTCRRGCPQVYASWRVDEVFLGMVTRGRPLPGGWGHRQVSGVDVVPGSADRGSTAPCFLVGRPLIKILHNLGEIIHDPSTNLI